MTWTIALQFANLFIVPIVGWVVKQVLSRNEDRLKTIERAAAVLQHRVDKEAKANEDRHKVLDEKLSTKVSDEEWIRESMKARDKLDGLAVALARIEGKTDSTLFVAQAVNRLANSIETTGVKHNAA